MAGFEPAASAFQERPSTGLTVHPGKDGRGSVAVFMMGGILQWTAKKVKTIYYLAAPHGTRRMVGR